MIPEKSSRSNRCFNLKDHLFINSDHRIIDFIGNTHTGAQTVNFTTQTVNTCMIRNKTVENNQTECTDDKLN